MNKASLIRGYLSLFPRDCSVASSFVFNYNRSNFPLCREKLKEFGREVDYNAFGSRFYKRSLQERMLFVVAPEMFDAGHPHFHGLLKFNSRHLDERGPLVSMLLYEDIWQRVVPGGSALFKYMHAPREWCAYSTKETSFADDKAIWSCDFRS